jgi:ABC-2 type transport system ATP-binding protein
MPDETWAINVSGLSKRFGDKQAVDAVSLQVKSGEIFGFLGPNGGGKTTTIRMICGLLTPDAGSGTCLGFDILTEGQLIKQNIGYMTQKFSLYEDLTIYENLDFVARMYGLTPREEYIAKGIAFLGIPRERCHQLAGTLSGGWKQRLALAAAIIHEPKVLLLDEPTAGVDPKARRDFWDEIHRLSHTGITTLVSTHYMDEAARCDHLAYISNGKIILKGTMDEIITQSALTTWEIQGPDLDVLAEELRTYPEQLQVANYGRSLHVSSTQATSLAAIIENLKTTQHRSRPIATTLEDVFIYYMSASKGLTA